MKRLGIFGGTFSPPHIGHTNAAREFLKVLELDSLLIIPTFIPPHKQAYEIDPDHRLEMTRLAFSQEEGFNCSVTVSDFELIKKGVSYTYLTLEHFSSPDTRLFFLCGTDMFMTLEQWKLPERIFELSDIVLTLRESASDARLDRISAHKDHLEKDLGARITVMSTSPIEISSSELRRDIASGKDVSKYLPPSVYDYIRKNRLYKTI
ncbi:MAG: nicotinate-nucleotide adenylyltransferase [Clostridia bacterium]|nr:nicotinate-nucleotide adenylyltransferase [Clostridia bacterium]